jgi:MFS family permease
MPATPPDTGPPTRVVSTAAASNATATPSSGAPRRRLGLALAVIATAQLMVVLDGTIVNVALPHIQNALGFSDSNLAWIVNVYALVFGGLLLLGGRSGDLLGRRRIFITGILVFAAASLLGGFATDQAWLLAARALQGVGGAMAAPTALSLIAVTFPEGPPRNRAMGVYASMSVAGAAAVLIAGGLLVSYLNWRWVFFVNISLCVGAALFGMFFFLTIFVQNVWGYSPLKTGISFLPITAMIILASGIASQAVPRIGARPLMIAGSAVFAGGMFWLSRISEHSSYAGGLLGPMLITALGLGLLFVPMALVSLTKVRNADTGVASSLVNVGQQVGGSIGLALLGTVAWSAVATSLRSQTAAAAGHPLTAATQTQIQHHALATGFSRGFLVCAAIGLLALIIALAAIRVTREDLSGVDPLAAPAD